jgi:hypothetical protein
MAAVDGLEIDLIVALGSFWAPWADDSWRSSVRANVKVTT